MSRTLGAYARKEYGAAYVTVHRGDLQAMQMTSLQPGSVQFGKCLSSVEDSGSDVVLRFQDGSEARADIVIGADGINSKLREHLLGWKRPLTAAGGAPCADPRRTTAQIQPQL